MPYTSWFSPARYLCSLTQMALICKTWLQCCDLYKVKLDCSIMGSGKSSTLLNWQPRPGTSPHSLTHTHTHSHGTEGRRESVRVCGWFLNTLDRLYINIVWSQQQHLLSYISWVILTHALYFDKFSCFPPSFCAGSVAACLWFINTASMMRKT